MKHPRAIRTYNELKQSVNNDSLHIHIKGYLARKVHYSLILGKKAMVYIGILLASAVLPMFVSAYIKNIHISGSLKTIYNITLSFLPVIIIVLLRYSIYFRLVQDYEVVHSVIHKRDELPVHEEMYIDIRMKEKKVREKNKKRLLIRQKHK